MLNVAIVGGGFMGSTHAKCYNNIGHKVIAIVDLDESKHKYFIDNYNAKGYSNLEDLLKNNSDNIDIVDICVGTSLHEDMVLLAAKYKKNIMCEKPISLTLEAVDNIIKAVDNASVIFMVGQVLHFWQEYVKIKEWYDSGLFGDIKLVSATRLGQHPLSNWYKDPSKSGSGLFEFHVHDIDFLCYMFGDVKSVYSSAREGNEYKGSYNFAHSIINFKNSVSAMAEEAFGITDNYPFSMNFRIVGSKATAEFSFSAGFNLDDLSSANNTLMLYRNAKPPHKETIISRDPYEIEIEYFTNCVEKKEKPRVVDIMQIRETIKTLLALKKSIETKNIVEL